MPAYNKNLVKVIKSNKISLIYRLKK